MFCLSAANPSFIALLRDTRVRSCKHSSRQLAWCETLSAEDAGGWYYREGFCFSPYWAPPFLLLQWWSACRTPSGVSGSCWYRGCISREFRTIPAGVAFCLFRISTSGFPWNFSANWGLFEHSGVPSKFHSCHNCFPSQSWKCPNGLFAPRSLQQHPRKAGSWNVLWAGQWAIFCLLVSTYGIPTYISTIRRPQPQPLLQWDLVSFFRVVPLVTFSFLEYSALVLRVLSAPCICFFLVFF